ncbi:hypothetical protein HGI45_00310 [Helicobacter pylori]|uniref:hypothetical protein n=1 Tax=Helicobacter pylori TaxID=210 RepID=UPI00192144D5|nr:hypothetical protein [Helicobacter pylori]QQW65415.1 hypothetical protein HGI45_00310 [Helicobacter pylori]WRA29849.1 hypothetical protein KVM90_00290 [Helicobacter pylori]
MEDLENKKAELLTENQNLAKQKTELSSKITGLSTDKENLIKDKTELTEKNQRLTTEKTELNNKITGLAADKERLAKERDDLTKEKENLTKANTGLKTEKENLTKEKTELTNKNAELQKQVQALEQSQQVLKNGNAELSKDKENLTATLSTAKTQAEQTSQKLNELEQRHAPYQKLEKLYEVFLEVKDRLNFNFVATTHSAMDLIASVLSDSKYYLESLYNQASQELSDKRSDKGEKLAELFDLLFEYVKDSKFERLKEPSAYDYSCKKLYPEQNTSQKMQRVVLRGYKHNDKVYHTIVDMGS